MSSFLRSFLLSDWYKRQYHSTALFYANPKHTEFATRTSTAAVSQDGYSFLPNGILIREFVFHISDVRMKLRQKDNGEKEKSIEKGTIRKEIGRYRGKRRGTFDSIFYRDSRHFSTCRWSRAFFEALDCVTSTCIYMSILSIHIEDSSVRVMQGVSKLSSHILSLHFPFVWQSNVSFL